MIVLERDGRLLLVKQLDHAGLAGVFARAWGNQRFEAPGPLDEVALAAGRHDEGWREWDDELRLDERRHRPLQFLDVDIRDYVKLYARGIERIAGLDPYSGLLVSLHGTGNVCGRWGAQRGIRLSGFDPATWPAVIEPYVLKQEALQARLKLAILGLDPSRRRSAFERRLWFNYDLLQAWDRLSLFLCRTDPGATAELSIGEVPASEAAIGLTGLTARALGAGRATVEPWPFAPDTLEVAVDAIPIDDRRYGTGEEIREAVSAAPAFALAWRLTKEA